MGVAAKGTLLKVGDGAATEAFTTVYQVRDINVGGLTADTEDVTHQTSTIDEIVATVVRGSDVTFTVNANIRNATQSTDGIRGDIQARTERNIQIVMPAATSTAADVLALVGYFTGYTGPTLAVSGALTRDVTFRFHKTLPTWTTLAAIA